MIKKFILSLFLVFILTTNSFAAAISTLTDNFNDNSIDGAKWTTDKDTGVTVLEVNQEIEITSALTSGYGKLFSANTYDLTGSQETIKIVDAGNLALSSWQVNMGAKIDSTHILQWEISGTFLEVTYNAGAGKKYPQTLTYNSTTHKYLRIREASGTTYWDTSADGITWTNRYSISNPITVTALTAYIGTYAGVELSTTTAKVDDFNYPSTSSQVIIVSE